MAYDQLKLENQICFPVYAASRLITKAYQPFLDELGITYPQYLVLMVLWEADGLGVNEIAAKLLLQTNTVTPLLKRMEQSGLVTRERSREDERKVLITLTGPGRALENKAALVPAKLVASLGDTGMVLEEILALKGGLEKLVEQLKASGTGTTLTEANVHLAQKSGRILEKPSRLRDRAYERQDFS